MKVLMIAGSVGAHSSCGVGHYTYNLISAYEHKYGKGSITCLTDTEYNCSLHGVIHRKIKNWSVYSIIKALASLETTPDIVHIQYHTRAYGRKIGPIILPFLVLLLTKKIPVQTWHENFASTYKSGLLHFLPLLLSQHIITQQMDIIKKSKRLFDFFLNKKHIYYQKGLSNIPYYSGDMQELLQISQHFRRNCKYIACFFGVISEGKQVEKVFEWVESSQYKVCILLVGDIPSKSSSKNIILEKISEKVSTDSWNGRLYWIRDADSEYVAKLLKIADMALFPFKDGADHYSSSVNAALAQCTYVIHTSKTDHPIFIRDENRLELPLNINNPSELIFKYLLSNRVEKSNLSLSDWSGASKKHNKIYEKIMNKRL